MNINKPLSEWTLGEVKAECEKTEDCSVCRFCSKKRIWNMSHC